VLRARGAAGPPGDGRPLSPLGDLAVRTARRLLALACDAVRAWIGVLAAGSGFDVSLWVRCLLDAWPRPTGVWGAGAGPRRIVHRGLRDMCCQEHTPGEQAGGAAAQ